MIKKRNAEAVMQHIKSCGTCFFACTVAQRPEDMCTEGRANLQPYVQELLQKHALRAQPTPKEETR